MGKTYPLAERLASIRSGSADELLELFLSYIAELGLELYPAQEEAILELFEGRHVVLSTPTGSGKSLVASALIFRTLSQGGRAFYTCPIKALVNEKFFQLVDAFGPEKVGLMTGDAAVNTDAPIICCTAEVASSMCLRAGQEAGIDGIVMDEFHYYGDRDRGIAWQIPLLILGSTHFLLMSATIGDETPHVAALEQLTGRKAVVVTGKERPVPLDFTYSEEPLHLAVKHLTEGERAPVYVVCFTQRSAAQEAQNLMSENYSSKDDKRRIIDALDGFRFDSAYGKEISRFVKHGIGLHHAGLLPKYRLLVERLAQLGLMKVICGTDTLGVGVNIPIRTVLFSKLCKFDGEKVGVLSAREFQQISGRAGRKGFDDRGSVVVQAPEHAIENLRIDNKKSADPKKHRNLQRAKPPTKGYAHWDRATFDQLQEGKAEPLKPRFQVSHGMLIDLLDNETTGKRGGYGKLLELIDRSHVTAYEKRAERKRAPQLFRALRHAGLIELVERQAGGKFAVVAADLQRDFSMHQALGLWLIDFVRVLHETKTDEHTYVLEVISAVEAILESPRVILERQVDKLKGDRIAELKAAGVEYEERMAELEKVDYPKPSAELIYETFNTFAEQHPWASTEAVRPKSIARELFEKNMSFGEYVREYDLARIEGVLLRYLSDALRTLEQSVAANLRTEDFELALLWLKQEVRSVDSSLLDEWERRALGETELTREVAVERGPPRLADDPKAILVRVRRELHRFVKALSLRDFTAAAEACLPREGSSAKALETALGPFIEQYGAPRSQHQARVAELTQLEEAGPLQYRAFQTLVGPEGPTDWLVSAVVDLSGEIDETAPLIEVLSVAEA